METTSEQSNLGDFESWRSALIAELERDFSGVADEPPTDTELTRHCQLDPGRVNTDQRSVAVILTQGEQGQRSCRAFDYVETLRLQSDSVRLPDGGELPLYLGEESAVEIGVCRNVRVHDNSLRCTLYFHDTTAGERALQSVQRGHCRDLALAYSVSAYCEGASNTRVMAVDWEPRAVRLIGGAV